jgi:hypothetical protein
MRSLGGGGRKRPIRVDEEPEPEGRLLHERAALEPQCAVVGVGRQAARHHIRQPREDAARRLPEEVGRPIGEELAARAFVVGHRTARRCGPDEVVVREAVEMRRKPVSAGVEPVDLLEQPRRIGIEGLPGRLAGTERNGFVAFPRLPVRLDGAVGQGIEAILGPKLEAQDGHVVGPGPLRPERPGGVDVSVGRAVQVGRVSFERMGAELLDVDGDRRRQTLRAEGVVPERPSVRGRPERQPPSRPGLVAGDQRLGIEDGRGRPREDGDPARHGLLLTNRSGAGGQTAGPAGSRTTWRATTRSGPSCRRWTRRTCRRR